jgi:peptidoglycan/xylan/chitin deacetylase (PgdA/CDA1 family)
MGPSLRSPGVLPGKSRTAGESHHSILMNSLLKFVILSTLFTLACNLSQARSDPLATQDPYDPFVAGTRATVKSSLEPALSVPEATLTASPVPTPTWVTQGPGSVEVPILLYHRIDISPINSRYYVAPNKFKEQMEWLHSRGYATIHFDLLVDAILHGAPLPPRPIVITFDDGNTDNYLTAFPIMQQYGFTGVMYIVGKYIAAPGYMDKAEILEMVEAGWEVGSHGLSHLDLLFMDKGAQEYEIRESRRYLKDALGVPVLSFAYPFGSMDAIIADTVSRTGYIAAVGTISSPAIQDINHLYHMRRKEIIGSLDIGSFASYLRWKDEVN